MESPSNDVLLEKILNIESKTDEILAQAKQTSRQMAALES